MKPFNSLLYFLFRLFVVDFYLQFFGSGFCQGPKQYPPYESMCFKKIIWMVFYYRNDSHILRKTFILYWRVKNVCIILLERMHGQVLIHDRKGKILVLTRCFTAPRMFMSIPYYFLHRGIELILCARHIFRAHFMLTEKPRSLSHEILRTTTIVSCIASMFSQKRI